MFSPYKKDHGPAMPIEYHEVTAGTTLAVGQALAFASGKLAKCGATAKPEFIAMGSVATAPAGAVLPVMRVLPDIEFETELSVDSASIAKGAKYTLDADAMKITATTTNGVADVTGFDGTAAGDRVWVRFA